MQFSVLYFKYLSLLFDVCNKASWNVKFIFVLGSILLFTSTWHKASILKLFGDKAEFSSSVRDFLLKFGLVKGLLSDNLTTQVLDLSSHLLLYGVVLFSHYISPDHVQVVKNLWYAGFAHQPFVSLFNGSNAAYSFSRNPVIIELGLCFSFWTGATRSC